MGFEDDPSSPGRRVWYRSSWRAVGSGIATVVLGLLSLFLLVASGLAVAIPGDLLPRLLLGLFMLAVAGCMAALTAYVWRDMRGKLGGLIALNASSLTLRLPGDRSLIHNPPRCHETVPFSDVEAIQMRLEAYGAQGAGIMQRAYRLKRRNGPPIFLFEERALGTRLADRSMQAMASEIASRIGVPLDDLGMVQGRGGILGAWFTKAPDWSAAPLSEASQSRLWRRVALTGALASFAVVVIWILSAVL